MYIKTDLGTDVSTRVERVELDGQPQTWVESSVTTLTQNELFSDREELEAQIFYSAEFGHRLNLTRDFYTTFGGGWTDVYTKSQTVNLLNARFTLLELKTLRDTLSMFIDTAEADGFTE